MKNYYEKNIIMKSYYEKNIIMKSYFFIIFVVVL